MKGVMRKMVRFEMHHQILFFSAVLIAAILVIRIGVQFYNPNPKIFGIELHHFDYGIMLLLLTVKFLLFGSERFRYLYLVMGALGTAFIVDGYLALRLSVVEPIEPLELYNATVIQVVVSLIVGTLTVLFIRALLKRRGTLPEHKR